MRWKNAQRLFDPAQHPKMELLVDAKRTYFRERLPMLATPRLTFLFLVILVSAYPLCAETEQQHVETTIRHQDALFWDAYNRCDNDGFRQFFTDDVEFYHDHGGPTLGADSLVTSLKKNICGNPDHRVRREAVPDTVKVFTLQKDSVTYGAVISGDHLFYTQEKGTPERLDGQAKFFDLWMVKDGVWKMSRIISYDHGPAPYVNKRTEAKLANDVLDLLAGNYAGPQTGALTVQREQDHLVLLTKDNKRYLLYPESENKFFSRDHDLTFEFVKNDKNQFSKMIIREAGEIVETAESSR
jgi:hypothetical protein